MSGSRTGFSEHSVSGSPIISQFRVFVREIIDLSNAVFVWVAKKLLVAVLNLLCRFLLPLRTLCLISLGNFLRVCGDCLTAFPNTPCRVDLREIIDLSNAIFVSFSLTAPHSMQIYGDYLTGFSKHSVSGSPIISQF